MGIEGPILNCGSCLRLISVLVLPSENHAAAVLPLPFSSKVQLSFVILFWNAEYVGAFTLPTIASAKPCSCLYFMPVAFLNRDAAAKHAFEKLNGRPTFP